MGKITGSNKSAPVTVENLLGCGCFQGIVFLSLQWAGFVQACNMLFMAFGKAMPSDWACMDADAGGVYENGTKFNMSLQCSAVESDIGCQNFTWKGNFYSIVPHYQLVCGRVKYIYLIMTLQMLGALFGSPVFGQLSDSFGRKWTLFSALTLLLASSTASGFAPSWQAMGALRFVVGFAVGGCILTNHVFIMEFLTRKHRLWVSNIAGWSISYMLLVAIAYATADWRKLVITTNIAGIPALAIVLFVGESPRWLLQRGRIAEAEKQLRRICWFNRHVVNENEMTMVIHGGQPMGTLEAEKVESVPTTEMDTDMATHKKPTLRKYTYWHLFTTKSLAVYTVILSITYFCISLISSGITFNVDKLSGNLFANFAIMGGLRWASNLCTVGADLLIKWYGRRIGLILPLFLMCMSASAVTLTHIFAPNYENLRTVVVVLSMAMSFLTTPIWIMVYLSNTELFPTPIRNIAHAFCATFNRLGGVAAPQILYLAHFWKPAPFAVFAGVSLMAAVLFGIFIPETKGKPLPEKMPEKSAPHSAFGHLRRRRSKSQTENLPDIAYHAVPNKEVPENIPKAVYGR